MAIAHIIASPSIEEASRRSSVSRATLHKWLKNDAFKAELRSKRDVVVNSALNTLKSAASQAVDELIELIKAPRAEVRLSASKCIIEYVLKSREIENIEQRLEKVERVILEKRTYSK